MANSPSFRWLIEQYPDAYILAVTATPYPKGGMRHLADEIVSPITMTELIEQGFLVPARYFIPSAIDLSGVAIDRKTQDYVAGQLSDRMNTAKLFGDMIASYKTMGENRPALCFAVSIEHSRRIVESFNAAGIPSAHIEADTPLEERQKIIRGLEENRIKIISNVGCLTTGVDIPAVSCIIMARPTKSYMLHIQCLGRATRIHPGKEDFIVLDHAANIQEHGFIEHEREVDLDGKEVKKKDIQLSMCSICYRAFVGTICPSCGKNKKGNVNEERNTDTDTSVQLVEIRSAEDLEKTRIQTFTDSCIKKAERNGYKPGWIYHQIKKRFGEKHAKGQWSKLKAIVPRSTRQAGDTDNPFDE
jgi:superfamily II DNA or RNA helicase